MVRMGVCSFYPTYGLGKARNIGASNRQCEPCSYAGNRRQCEPCSDANAKRQCEPCLYADFAREWESCFYAGAKGGCGSYSYLSIPQGAARRARKEAGIENGRQT